MLSRTITFIVMALFTFSVLNTLLPTDFRTSGSFTTSEIANYELSANNLFIYANQGTGNMTYPYSSLPNWTGSGIPDGEYLEVWWGLSGVPDVGTIGPCIELRHSQDWWWGYRMIDNLNFYYKTGEQIGPYLTYGHLINGWNTQTNSSAFTARCAHIQANIIFRPANQSYGSFADYPDYIEYTDEPIWYALSFEWNEELTAFSILSTLTSILSFKGSSLSIPGPIGNAVNIILGTFFWIGVAYLLFRFIVAVVPFLGGMGGD